MEVERVAKWVGVALVAHDIETGTEIRTAQDDIRG